MTRLLVPLVAVLAAACSSAAAAPMAAPAGAGADPSVTAALGIVERVSGRHDDAVPDLTGQDAATARAAIAAIGGDVQVLAFDTAPAVSAQYPPAGTALPADGVVTVWLGTPPDPPDPPEPGPSAEGPAAPAPGTAAPPVVVAAEPAAAQVVARVEPAELAPAAGPAPQPAAPPQPPPASPSGPRSNIRTIEPLPAGAVLEGRASWYGPGFAGRTTACGDAFDPAQLTLASRELRCGTKVRVAGPTGTSVEATVTDWGPAEWTNRRFDLSQATFAAIHHPGAGVITVTLEVLP